MAFIYQYDLVRSGEEIFNIYDNDNMEIIENTIRDIFGGRVKEIDIESEDGTNRPYIQFKLYESATNGELRKLGKMIKARINNCPGIQRRKQKAYFIVEEVDDENNEIQSVLSNTLDPVLGIRNSLGKEVSHAQGKMH